MVIRCGDHDCIQVFLLQQFAVVEIFLGSRKFAGGGVETVFIYIAIKRGLEPYELLPIGLGIIIANLPLTGLATFTGDSDAVQGSGIFGIIFHFGLSFWNFLPPIIFLGLGAMTDFGPILANPRTILLGAAAQIGIFAAFWGAVGSGLFTMPEAAAIGIIGGADGPTTIFLSALLAPELLGITALSLTIVKERAERSPLVASVHPTRSETSTTRPDELEQVDLELKAAQYLEHVLTQCGVKRKPLSVSA